MKKISLTIILLTAIVGLSACQLEENYVMQYGFSNEIITETKFETIANGLKLEVPFADFSCDPQSFKGILDRKEKTFTLTLEGTETTNRCSQKFYANITGIQPGNYWMAVVYNKNGQKNQVVYEQFSIQAR